MFLKTGLVGLALKRNVRDRNGLQISSRGVYSSGIPRKEYKNVVVNSYLRAMREPMYTGRNGRRGLLEEIAVL